MKVITDPNEAAEIIQQTFEHILLENMQGIPILNNKLRVQTLGFQIIEQRITGIVITPWLMNLIILPNEQDDWKQLELGEKTSVSFPSTSYKFMINEIDGIGKCKTHSLYSPMHEFDSHDHALTMAQTFLDKLLVKREATEEELIDEDLLGRIMRGEEIEVNLDDFAAIEPISQSSTAEPVSRLEEDKRTTGTDSAMSRRDIIRGKFLKG